MNNQIGELIADTPSSVRSDESKYRHRTDRGASPFTGDPSNLSSAAETNPNLGAAAASDGVMDYTAGVMTTQSSASNKDAPHIISDSAAAGAAAGVQPSNDTDTSVEMVEPLSDLSPVTLQTPSAQKVRFVLTLALTQSIRLFVPLLVSLILD